MKDPIIKLENLKKSYNHTFVLDIPYLEFEANKLHIILGPNGSGKTTLLSILADIEKIDHGKIYYKNKEVDNGMLRRKITLVLQSPYIFNTTVFNNIAYGLKIRSVAKKEIDDKVSVVLKKLGLEKFTNQNGIQLSQGEMHKVAIARALVIDPDMLLLDEPYSDLDPFNIQLVENLLKETKKTIIMTTQDKDQTHRLADVFITIKNGKVSYV
ncbi:MAG: ABC transporter ATP-binding protein [Elusimicrobia bacterium]|nr:ABC transporter ATP-binding protein [Elusimicrobiota bacterium]